MRPSPLLIALSLTLGAPAAAGAPALHVQLHGLSWHSNTTYAVYAVDTGEQVRRERFNRANLGAGLRYALSPALSLQVGAYRHSFASRAADRVDGDWAPYALVDYLPLQRGQVALGASLGAVRGYPPARAHWRPLGALTGRWQGDRVSVTLRATYGREGGAVVAADLGWRL